MIKQLVPGMKILLGARNGAVTKYWLRFYATGHCTLCGNSGVIDTRGVKTPAGLAVGRLNWCICPNGQTLRRSSGLDLPTDIDAPGRPFRCKQSPITLGRIDDKKWADWEKERRDELEQSERLINDGHNRHCSYGIVWGSGSCTCNKRGIKKEEETKC